MAKKHSKRLKNIYSSLDIEKLYSIDEAVKIIKDGSKTKFDETIEVSMNLNVDPRHADQQVRGVTGLPSGLGKKVSVIAIVPETKMDEAKKAGADVVGSEEFISEVQKSGKIEACDTIIATPDMMAHVGKIGKILGPKGLMPNPKLGTVTPNISEAIKKAKEGQVQYRAEKAGIVHAGVGKISFSAEDLVANVKAFIQAVLKAKPSGVKGSYLKAISLSSTMGPGLKLDIQSVN